MKRAASILAILFASGALFAQVHGPGASVLSSGKGSAPVAGSKSMVTGPAASVLSTGPRGWQAGPCMTPQCVNPVFTPTVNYQTGTVEFNQHFNTGQGGKRHHKPGNGGGNYYGGGYVYSYPVYVPVPVELEPVEEEQPEPPALTVFENRPQVRLAPNPTPMEDAPYAEQTMPARQAEKPQSFNGGHHQMSPVSDEQIPMVIVFKDGHEQEINNYAIVADTLYDLGTFVAHKIKLADLDLKQTIKKNEDRGLEFNLPASYRPTG